MRSRFLPAMDARDSASAKILMPSATLQCRLSIFDGIVHSGFLAEDQDVAGLCWPPTRRGASLGVKTSRNHNAGDVAVAAITAVLRRKTLHHAAKKRSKGCSAPLLVFDELRRALLLERCGLHDLQLGRIEL